MAKIRLDDARMITVSVNAANALRSLNLTESQIKRISARALNETSFAIKKIDGPKGFDKHIDRPTPFTKRGFRVKKAKARKLMSVIYIAPVQAKYLHEQVFGGTRTEKHPVPGKKIKLNKYGNLTRRATKRKGVFSISKGGKNITMIRTGKRTVKTLAIWPTARKYKKRVPFMGIVLKGVKRSFNREYKKAYKRIIK